MGVMNLESSKFNSFLNKLADDSYTVMYKKGRLILNKSDSIPEGLFEEKVLRIVDYIKSHAGSLSKSQITLIEKVQSKLKKETEKQNDEIQKKVLPLLEQLKGLTPSVKTEKTASAATSPAILLQIAPVPKNRHEFEANLRLVLENFPKYQFHDDLSVFDSSFQSFPSGWNHFRLMSNLRNEFKKYEIFDSDRVSNLSLLKNEILPLLKMPEPKKMSIIVETSPVGTSNTAMLLACANSIKRGVPCLLNREFFQIQSKNIEKQQLLNQDLFDIYVQKDGDLCALIPKGYSLREWGFNADQFELSTGQHLKPSVYPFNLAQGLKSVLASETDDLRFCRLVEFHGHGSNPKGSEEGEVAGLKIKEFQDSLLSLHEKNLVFMEVDTCYAGGANSTEIHLPNHVISCPIYVHSSFETVTYAGGASVLEAAEKMIFPSRLRAQKCLQPLRQLNKNDRQKLMQLASSNRGDLVHKFTGLGTLLLPSNQQDIPKVAYTIADPNEILDVSRAQREQWGCMNPDEAVKALEDSNVSRKAYVFSDPIVPFTLSASGVLPMILLSRGGSAQHVIKEVIAPQQDIVDIAKETFNAFSLIGYKSHEESASKAFFVAKMQCKYEGRNVKLAQVTMVNSKEQRKILFKIDGEEEFHMINFYKTDELDGYTWKKGKTETVSLNEALKEIYMSALDSIPTSESLIQRAGGRKSQLEVLEALDSFFFQRMPPAAKLYSAILKGKFKRSNQPSDVKNVLNEIKAELSHSTGQKLHHILYNALEMAQKLNLSKDEFEISQFSHTPLMRAVAKGDLELAKEVLKDNPQTLNLFEATGGYTALHIAFIGHDIPIAKWLIEQGADLHRVNGAGDTPFILACTKTGPAFVKWLLEKGADFKGKDGADALCQMIANKDWRTAHLLLDYRVGSEADSDYVSFVEFAITYDANIKFVKKILSYPNIDINFPSEEKMNTLVHLSVYKNRLDVLNLLLARGADPNRKNIFLTPPLHWVSTYATKDSVSLAKALLRAGAAIDSQDEDGCTPLHLAIKKGDKDLILFLIKNGASLNIEDKNKKNPLDYALGSPALLEYILRNSGVKIPELPRTGLISKILKTAYDLSASVAALPYTKPKTLADAYQPPLMTAIASGKESEAASLIDEGADVNDSDKYGNTALTFAVKLNKPRLVNLLIDNGADLNHLDQNGNSALYSALSLASEYAEDQILPLISLLIKRGAKFDIPNKAGLSAKDQAIKLRLGKVVQLMQT